MRLDEFIEHTKDLPRNAEIEVYDPYEGQLLEIEEVNYVTYNNTIQLRAPSEK